MGRKVRQVSAYKDHFEKFLKKLPAKAQNKVFKIIEAIETIQVVPSHYLKKIQGVDGLFEARVKLGSNIWRVFCFFDGDKLIILLNGYQKKEQKTSQREISRAQRLMTEYYADKNRRNEER